MRIGDSRPVHEAITYLENHREDMRYATARRLGLPVGSGNVEKPPARVCLRSASKRPGCRWKTDSGGHIVDLRALALSDRYQQALALSLSPLRQHVSVSANPLYQAQLRRMRSTPIVALRGLVMNKARISDSVTQGFDG